MLKNIVNVCVLPAWLYTTHMSGACRVQKQALGSLELELRMLVNCHVTEELNPCLQQEQQMFLASELSLQLLQF
jgi:hypothetical protein